MSVQNRPVQVQPNLPSPPKPPEPEVVAMPGTTPAVVHIALRDAVMMGHRQFTKTIIAKEHRARFEFDDERRMCWVYVSVVPGEELMARVPYENIANVFYGTRKTQA